MFNIIVIILCICNNKYLVGFKVIFFVLFNLFFGIVKCVVV